MKKQILLIAAVAFAAQVLAADLGPWNIGYTNPTDVVASIEINDNDTTLRVTANPESTTHDMKLFYITSTEGSTATGTTAPWEDIASQIHVVVIDSGVTSIGDNAFYSMRNLKKLYIAASVDEVSGKMFHRSYVYNHIDMYCYRDTAAQVVNEDPDFVGSKRPYHDSTTVYVPSKEAVSKYQGDASQVTWWSLFSDYRGKTQPAPESALVADSIKPDKVSIVFPLYGATDAEKKSITYNVKVTNLTDPTDEHNFKVKFNNAGNKWEILTSAAPAGKIRRMPIIMRDTVSGTTETMQIDITNLKSNSSYSYSVTGVNTLGNPVTQKEGAFLTPAKKATDIEEMSTVNYQLSTKKIFRNGQVVILRDGKIYDLLGAEIE